MMGFIHVAVCVLCLLSVGQSAPVDSCESLTQTIDIPGRDQMLGKWWYFAESTNIPGSKALTEIFVKTVWTKNVPGDQNDTIILVQTQKMFGQCISVKAKLTVSDNTVSMVQPYPSTAVLLRTSCPDCAVYYSNLTIGLNSYRALQLLSRTNNVSAEHKAEFSKQVECLDLPSALFLDQQSDACPDEKADTGTIDITSAMEDMGPKGMEMVEKILNLANTEEGLSQITEMISGGTDGFGEN